MNKKTIWIIFVLCLSVLFTGCVPETPEETPDIAGTAAAMAETIVAAQLTKIAEDATSTPTPTLTPTQTPTQTLTVSLPTPFPTLQTNEDGVCLMAHLVSETYPDNSKVEAGEKFIKQWVLYNAGNCTWTEEFSVVFHHGETFGAIEQSFFPGAVKPGESFTLQVPMVAPAVAGEHLSFWTLMSPDGETFGTRTSNLFWAKINVQDLVAASALFDLWAPSSEGSVLATGEMLNNLSVGDTKHDYAWQGFVGFNLNNVPLSAEITAVSLVFQGNNVTGTPFTDLGCMGVYRYNYGNLDPFDYYTDTPGGALWSFCSLQEVTAGISRLGGADAVSAIQNSIGGTIQFRFQFNNDTDNDDFDDIVTLFPLLRIEWTVP